MKKSCELVTFVTTLAIAIAQDKSSDEVSLIAAIFTQLGDTLATISTQEEYCTAQFTETNNRE